MAKTKTETAEPTFPDHPEIGVVDPSRYYGVRVERPIVAAGVSLKPGRNSNTVRGTVLLEIPADAITKGSLKAI